MSRSRMWNSEEPAGDQPSSPRTTIVGGRPPEEPAAGPPVPTGIQRLLRLASVDVAFRAELVARRAEVAAAADVELSASEATILGVIPERQLLDMARKMPPPTDRRRDLLRKTAATAVILLGGAALAPATTGCEQSNAPAPAQSTTPRTTKQKSTAEPLPERPMSGLMNAGGGAAPDMPPEKDDSTSSADPDAGEPAPERPDHRATGEEGGISPDLP